MLRVQHTTEIDSANMFVKMYGRFCRHLYECWIK